jgi:hypothetical protein
MFILEWESNGFGFFSPFKLVHLGELRLVYLGIWACLVIEDKLFCLFWLPFWIRFTVTFFFFKRLKGWSGGRKQILRTVFTLCGLKSGER